MEEFLNKKQFKGSTPPEIFIGREGYPKVYAGILSPVKSGDTEDFSSPEKWYEKNASMKEIINYRKQLLYARFKADIKPKKITKLTSALNQVALARKSVSAEFFLQKSPASYEIKEFSVPIIGNPAPLEDINLEENPKIHPKADYISSDTKLKSAEGIKELYNYKLEVSNIIKILSAGLLGLKENRKLVPTKWAITAVDDTLSKEMLKKIRFFNEINDFQVFNSEYLGNHYEILLLPDKFSFEVIEISTKDLGIWKDYEGFYRRKNYAANVTGAYYANRLALCEYLIKINRQCSCIFFREVLPTYDVPLGVGILRENARGAFKQPFSKFQTLKEALNDIQKRLTIPIEHYTNNSVLLSQFGKQKRLKEWF
ncbi:MAG: hypothetical protein WC533_04840 [Candidatus Pacearchaeota archaeon]